MASQHMLCAFQDGVMVAAHTRNDPSDEEWGAYIEMYRNRIHQVSASVAYTRGGGPSAKQRAELTTMLKGTTRDCRTAIIVPSMPKKAIVTALGYLMASPIRAFDPSQREGAYEFMHLNSKQRDAVNATLWHLCTELRIPWGTSQFPESETR